MKFPNAYEGVKKLFTAEILAVIALACTLITLLGAAVAVGGDQAGSVETAAAGLGVFGIFGICTAVLVIAALVLQILGLRQAGNDEPSFKLALYLVIAGLVMAVVFLFLPQEGFLADLLTEVADLLDLCVSLLVISGVVLLAGKCGNQDMDLQGHKLIKIMTAGIILASLSDILYRFFEMGGLVLGIVAVALQLAVYILYLLYLNRAKKMLSE